MRSLQFIDRVGIRCNFTQHNVDHSIIPTRVINSTLRPAIDAVLWIDTQESLKMPIPDFQALMLPVLSAYANAQDPSLADVRQAVARATGLTDKDIQEMLPSGHQSVFVNRVSWAVIHMARAGLLKRVRRGSYVLTQDGERLLARKPSHIDLDILREFSSYVTWSQSVKASSPGYKAIPRSASQMTRLKSVRICGFRSLVDVELSNLRNVNILIGANGSGKSNFVRFFEMLSWMLRGYRLGDFVERQGGADDQLFCGSRITPAMQAEISLKTQEGLSDYQFTLAHAHPDRLMFAKEAFRFSRKNVSTKAPWTYLDGDGDRREAQIVEVAYSPQPSAVNKAAAKTITHLLGNCTAYQFHDTSDISRIKTNWDMEDNNTLLSHGGNLAAVLYRLEHEDYQRYEMICHHIRRILPIFDRFKIESSYGNVRLRWKARWGEKTFGAHLTSDGSLRFFALVTLLNLPGEMLPNVVLLDEPELGLHPAAISLIGGMIKALAVDVQVIVATQSPLLVDEFGLEEIVFLEANDGRTNFRRLNTMNYREWLDAGFASGELWQKNLIGGRP